MIRCNINLKRIAVAFNIGKLNLWFGVGIMQRMIGLVGRRRNRLHDLLEEREERMIFPVGGEAVSVDGLGEFRASVPVPERRRTARA